jgi:hypothetical protein
VSCYCRHCLKFEIFSFANCGSPELSTGVCYFIVLGELSTLYLVDYNWIDIFLVIEDNIPVEKPVEKPTLISSLSTGIE